ncbi:MAG: restriction endonuclease subunit S [Putridiphycobacter sp.]|nr:restriction endonuclease subunit S [Putridiphycobacter sp.]
MKIAEKQMQKYTRYKNSGVEWLGEIPEHWEVKKLKFVGNIYAGINGKKGDDFSKEYSLGMKSFIPFTNICNNLKIDESQYQYVKIDEKENQNRVKHNDILFLMSSETLDDIAKCSIYLGIDKELYLNSFCKGFRITNCDINAEYINYLLTSKIYRNYFALVGRGFTRINLKQEFINDASVTLPPLQEQTAIAQFLDDKTTKIDQAIAIKEQQISLLKERKQILIHKAVTRGIRPLSEAEMKDSGVEWIGEIPEHWEVKKLKYATRIFRGKFTHRPRNDERMYDGKYPFFQTGDVARAGKYLSVYRQTLNEKGLRVSTLFPKGTVVITIAANIGDISILDINACFPDSIVGFEPNNFIAKYFLYNSLLVMKEQFMSSTIKNTQMNLNVDRIGSNSIAVPPLKEQIGISEYIETASQKIETAINLKQQEIEKLKEYKSSLINSVVTGKVKVC